MFITHRSAARLGLVLALAALAGCATQPGNVTLRRGKIIKAAKCDACCASQPAAEPLAEPAPVVVAPPAAPAPLAEVVILPVAQPEPAPAPVRIEVATPALAAVEPAPVSPAPGLVATRSGEVVTVRWTLPESPSGLRAIEIYRNSHETTSGRSRVRAVRASVTELHDTVPDAGADYWYWLKVTHVDGSVQNYGPSAAPYQS